MNRRMYAVGCVVLALVVMITPLIAEEESKAGTAPVSTSAASDPLVRVLLSKGVINAEEANYISSGSSANQREKLLYLLKEKGLLSSADLDALKTSTPQAAADYRTAVLTTTAPAAQQKPAEPAKPPAPKFIPAVAPLRVLQLEPSKKDGLIPDIKLGSGARLKLYGFLKMSAVYDTSSPYGNDFPLPGFIGNMDTGPNSGQEYHMKARSSRFGANFEWPDISDKLSFTGKIEMDFEGNFTRVNNRNISSIRSSQMSIRLAYGRLDYKINPNTSWFALFGQDWTPFGSSTLPNLLETTGLGIGFGTLYERDPQIRVGMQHNFGGDRKFTIAPEFAIVLPASGLPPAELGNQLGYGERQGPDSARPQVQGRLVFQWQLDKAPGVAPAQVIFSAMNGERSVDVARAGVPAGVPTTVFARGTSVSSAQNGVSAEIQFPTRFVTLIAKYYNGEDLRYYFANGLYSTFTDLSAYGLTPVTAAGTGVDGSAVTFVNTGTTWVVAPQRPIRTAGGFVNLGFPLGRIFHADPASRAAGWQLYLHYGIDDPYSRDVRRTVSAAAYNTSLGVRDRSDLAAATLYWKLNSLITFGYEESYYHTRTSGPGTGIPTGPVWDQGLARSWHDLRSEFSTIFTF